MTWMPRTSAVTRADSDSPLHVTTIVPGAEPTLRVTDAVPALLVVAICVDRLALLPGCELIVNVMVRPLRALPLASRTVQLTWVLPPDVTVAEPTAAVMPPIGCGYWADAPCELSRAARPKASAARIVPVFIMRSSFLLALVKCSCT